MVIDAAYFIRDKKVAKKLHQYSLLRDEALRRCYDIDGYDKLPIGDKNKIYDGVKSQIMKEWKI